MVKSCDLWLSIPPIHTTSQPPHGSRNIGEKRTERLQEPKGCGKLTWNRVLWQQDYYTLEFTAAAFSSARPHKNKQVNMLTWIGRCLWAPTPNWGAIDSEWLLREEESDIFRGAVLVGCLHSSGWSHIHSEGRVQGTGKERRARAFEVLRSNERLRFVYKDDLTLVMATQVGEIPASVKSADTGWSQTCLWIRLISTLKISFSRSFRPRSGTKFDLTPQQTSILNNSLV